MRLLMGDANMHWKDSPLDQVHSIVDCEPPLLEALSSCGLKACDAMRRHSCKCPRMSAFAHFRGKNGCHTQKRVEEKFYIN